MVYEIEGLTWCQDHGVLEYNAM